jgi:ribosomal protein L11 methyltransferase
MPALQFRFSFQNPDEEAIEILIAYLSEAGFEGFSLEEQNLDAYIPESNFEAGQLEEILAGPAFSLMGISWSSTVLEDKNWNEIWEKAYEPVIVEGICAVIAPFHSEINDIPNILIEPKMSFGTGHHATTRLMIQQIDRLDMSKKSILDMGCGTGVLGIFALTKGAENVVAIDIDEWACENSRENFIRNSVPPEKFAVHQGDASMIPSHGFDIILANINRNILLSDIPVYIRNLKTGGSLILSGILETDTEVINTKAKEFNLLPETTLHEGSWVSVAYKR